MDAVSGGRNRAEQAADKVALYERDTATTVISRVIDEACRGAGRAVFVRGDAGLGKTALLRWARERAPATMSIRRAQGSSMETDLAMAFAEQLIGVSEPAGSTPVPVDPLDRRSLVHQFARARLGSWTGGGPLLVLLDDLHWADRDSLDVIAYLVRRLATLPVALVGVLRPWPQAPSNIVDALVAEGRASVVDVPPLSRAASGRLLGHLLGGGVADRSADRVWAVSQGNPFLVGQAARVVHREGALPAGSDWAGELLLSKIAGLSSQVVECARAAAVLGGRTDLSAVQAVAALDGAEFADAFDTLVAAGVLQSRADGEYEMTHDLLTQSIVRDMGHARRRLLHRRAFQHYRRRHDAERAATHALAAHLRGDDEAVATVAEAGTRALAAGGVETGLRYLSRAIDLAAPEPPDSLLLRYADALFTVGRAVEALAVYQRVATRGRTAGVSGRLARALAHAGRLDESLALYEDLLADLPPGPARAAGLLERAHVRWERDGPAAALADLDAIPVGAPTGRFGRSVAAIRAYALLQTGDASGLPDLDRAAVDARARFTVTPGAVRVSMNAPTLQVSAFMSLERYDEALELVERDARTLREVGALRAVVPLHITRLSILLQTGRPAQVVSESLELEAATDIDPLPLPYIRLLRAQALAWLGRSVESASLCDEVESTAIADSCFAVLALRMVRAQLLQNAERPREALEVYRDVEELAHRFGIGEPCTPMWAAGAIEAALTAGSPRDAARIAQWLEECGTTLSCTRPHMVALAGRAGCAAVAGDDDLADRLYADALAVSCTAPLERTAILLRYGAWLRRRGQVRRSREPLAQALQTAQTCGAAPLARRAQEELAVAGGRRRRTRAAGALTRQEMRVAALAASGETSREIGEKLTLSTRTVDSHLAHVYRKLDVRSRRGLVQRRAELGLDLGDQN